MPNPVLQHALSRLPQYAPPSGLWEEIEAALDAEQHLSGAVRELPVYTPPETIWTNIETQLEQAPKQRRTIRAVWSMRVLLAAASLLLLLAAVRWIVRPTALPVEETIAQQTQQPNQTIASTPIPPNNPPGSKTTPQKPLKTSPKKSQTAGVAITVTQKVVDNQLLQVCREPENDAFALVDQLCRAQMPVCDIPEFKTLKTELDELTTAQDELRQALGLYADDPELVSQMVQLERERAVVLQQLMQFI